MYSKNRELPLTIQLFERWIEAARQDFPFEVGERTFCDKKTMSQHTAIGQWFVKWFGENSDD